MRRRNQVYGIYCREKISWNKILVGYIQVKIHSSRVIPGTFSDFFLFPSDIQPDSAWGQMNFQWPQCHKFFMKHRDSLETSFKVLTTLEKCWALVSSGIFCQVNKNKHTKCKWDKMLHLNCIKHSHFLPCVRDARLVFTFFLSLFWVLSIMHYYLLSYYFRQMCFFFHLDELLICIYFLGEDFI